MGLILALDMNWSHNPIDLELMGKFLSCFDPKLECFLRKVEEFLDHIRLIFNTFGIYGVYVTNRETFFWGDMDVCG